MTRRGWAVRTAVGGALTAAAAGLAETRGGVDPLTGAGLVLGGGSLLVHLTRAVTRPELEVFAPAVRRGSHPGRLAILCFGVPARGARPFGATCFVTHPDDARRALDAGLEPALLARPFAAVDPDALGVPVRWVHVPILHPGLALHGLRLVGPTLRPRPSAAALAHLGAGAVGTDLVALPPLDPDARDTLLDAWDARGIAATSVADALTGG